MKDEIYYEEGTYFAHVTPRAFSNDVTMRIAMQWIRAHPQLTAYVVEVPPEDVRPLLPGIVATFPRVQVVVVRCEEEQEAAVRAFVPFHMAAKLRFARYGERVKLGIVARIDEEGRPEVEVETLY